MKSFEQKPFLIASVQGLLFGLVPALLLYLLLLGTGEEFGPGRNYLGAWSPFAQSAFIFLALGSLGFVLSYARIKLVTSRRIQKPKRTFKWYHLFWDFQKKRWDDR